MAYFVIFTDSYHLGRVRFWAKLDKTLYFSVPLSVEFYSRENAVDTITPLTRAGIKSRMSLILGQIGVLLQCCMPLSIETFPIDKYKWRKCCGHNNAFSIDRIIIKLTGNQGITSWMSSNSSHIRPLTSELPALERRKKCCGHDSACIFDRLIIAGN